MKPDKGNNKRNTFGLITLILWALVLTFLFRSCSSSYASANEVQVDYSTFKEWVQQDKVDRVLMQSGKYTITLKEGVTVEVPEQNSSTSSIFFMSRSIRVCHSGLYDTTGLTSFENTIAREFRFVKTFFKKNENKC